MKSNGASNIYSHEPWYYDCGGWMYWIERRDWALTESRCDNPNWSSDNLKASLAYIEGKHLRADEDRLLPGAFPLHSEYVPRTKTIKVTLVLEVKNATVNEIYIPGLGRPKTPRMLFEKDRKGVVVYVDRDANSIIPKRYDLTVPKDQTTSPAIQTIQLSAGDRVTYEVYGNTDVKKEPIIKGVPKIWASGYAAQREFITTPDYGPNQYHPWVGYEAQTHFRLINSYPEKFKKAGIKTNNWKTHSPSKSWEWIAQRRTDNNKVKYDPVIYYPKTKKFILNTADGSYKYQRESQALGWSKQIMDYYDKYSNKKLGNEKYLTGFDVDEFLYVGSKNPNAPNVLDWQETAVTAGNSEYNPNIISVHNYPVDVFKSDGKIKKSGRSKNNNWQNLWESEKAYTGSSNNIIYNIPEKEEYPFVWDSKGMPEFGFLLNDMITRYQKYKSYYDDDLKNDLPSNYYYNGYEIQDVASHRQGPTPASLVIERDIRKPAPCKEGCWYFGNEGGENVKHQGQVKITIPTTTGNFIVSFKQQVKVPIDNNSNTHKGFYSSLQADHGQYTMGWGNKNTWTLQGVKQSDSKRISLVMLEYNAGTGMMLPASTKKIKGSEDLDDEPDGIKYATYNQYTKKLSASFEVSAGWVAIAAYYKTKDLKDSVIIAGRVPMVMDPPTSLTVPGSDPYPYFNQSLAISGDTNAIDLKEGQGDRAFETMNEVRGTIDAGRGYVHKLGVGQTKYHREYHIIKGNELNFSCLDVGRKMQSYWDNGSEDPYQSWRELAKRMPNDIISNKLDWNVYEMNADGAAPTKTGISTYTRHFNYQFNKVGTYEVWVTWKEAPKFTPTKVVVHVRENPDKEHPADYKNLDLEIERGKITLRPLSIEEQRWIKKHSKNLNGSPYTGIGSVELDRLKEYQVAEVDEILSEYAYVLGPRASEKIHREGLRRDFNDQYSWYHDHNKLELPEFIKTGFLGKFNEGVYNQDFDQNLLTWPETWDKIWLYHNPRKGTTAPVTDLTGVIRDGTDDVNQTMDVAFTKLEEAQSTLPWMRWFPWVAISPTNGYKMNRYIKTTLDLPKFLSNEGGHETGKGLFSGKAKTKVYDISNAIENMMWFDYGSPKATQVSTKELDRHLSDDKKNLLEFYNDLRYGRKMIFRPGNTGSPSNGDDILVKNKNPKKFTVSTITQDEIYIATAVVEDLSPHQNNIPGIPLLTFDGARSGKTLLNSTYTIDGGDASIVHKGRKKYLKIIANDWQNKDISINVNIPQHLFDNSSKGPGPRIADVVSSVFGFQVNLARESENEKPINFTLSANRIDGEEIIPMGPIDHKLINSNSLATVHYRFSPYSHVIHPKTFFINILKSQNPDITKAPIIYLDDLTLIDENPIVENSHFNMKDASETKLLNWLSESSYRFFDWNFKDIGNDLGVFLEAAGEDKISLSGQGMGIAVTLLAEKAGYITPTVAKNRITKVLSWLTGIQDGANYSELIEDAIGQTGWHGMPSHYFNLDGKIHNPPTEGYPNGAKYPLAVSTIDWAMCAQGLRLARQYYHDDHTIKILTTDLLMSVDWAKFVMPTKHKNGNTIYEEPKDDGEKIPFNNGGRIAFDVNPKTGEINMKGDAWGHDFSEETELVYLEVLASSHEKKTGESQHTNLPFTNMNDINKVIYIDKTKKVVAGVEVITERAVKIIDRKCKNGFIPSYFGSGFTYNWLQLWYGNYQWAYTINRYLKKSSYYDNSVKAYQADYLTAKEQFLGNAYMGLTAASTVDQIAPNGFVSYGKYLSNQGSDNYLAPQGEVVQVAPAPYGATLALPFNKAKAMEAIRAYIDLGFYHEYMGFPDNVVLKGTGALGPLPNWNQLDLNIAPIAMAIDLTKTAFISNQLINDKHAMNAYFYLYNSFIGDYGACPAPTQAHKKAEDKPVEITLEEAPQKDTILLYPNPNTGNFTLRIRIKDPGVYQGVFKDLQGRVLKHSQWEFDSGGTYEVPFVGLKQQGFSPGLYVMVVTGTSMKKSIPVLIKDK